jgi:hypothetical protein
MFKEIDKTTCRSCGFLMAAHEQFMRFPMEFSWFLIKIHTCFNDWFMVYHQNSCVFLLCLHGFSSEFIRCLMDLFMVSHHNSYVVLRISHGVSSKIILFLHMDFLWFLIGIHMFSHDLFMVYHQNSHVLLWFSECFRWISNGLSSNIIFFPVDF